MVSNALGGYIEAPIHGRVALAGDVEAVVIDRAFAKTRSADSLIAAADSYGLRVEWTPAITLELRGVPPTSPRETEQPLMRWELLLDDSRAYELAATVIDRFGNVSQLDAANIGAAAIDVVRRTTAGACSVSPPKPSSS